MEKLTVTVPEMAKMLGIGTWTGYNLIHKEGFPVIWIGKRAVIPVDGLKEWMKAQTAQTGATV